ncbi:MAG TPA: hypothetical protein VGD10_03915 [Allosphingosinicella sp.]
MAFRALAGVATAAGAAGMGTTAVLMGVPGAVIGMLGHEALATSIRKRAA